MHLQLRTIFLFERRDALGRVSLYQHRLAPLQGGMTPRRNVLRGVVQRLGPGLLRGVRPVRREYIVGLASENEVERSAHRLAHDLTHLIVPVVLRPAAVREAAAIVLFGSARSLHDLVKGQEGAHDQLSHFSGSLLSFPSYSPTHQRRTDHPQIDNVPENSWDFVQSFTCCGHYLCSHRLEASPALCRSG